MQECPPSGGPLNDWNSQGTATGQVNIPATVLRVTDAQGRFLPAIQPQCGRSFSFATCSENGSVSGHIQEAAAGSVFDQPPGFHCSPRLNTKLFPLQGGEFCFDSPEFLLLVSRVSGYQFVFRRKQPQARPDYLPIFRIPHEFLRFIKKNNSGHFIARLVCPHLCLRCPGNGL